MSRNSICGFLNRWKKFTWRNTSASETQIPKDQISGDENWIINRKKSRMLQDEPSKAEIRQKKIILSALW